jgi:SsrA-binding protein
MQLEYTFSMTLVEYKKVFLKYAPLESFAAGIELSGQEVKALRNKLGSLDGARVVVRGGEAFIVGMTIPPYQMANADKKYDPERARRLLLAKKEIATLADAESKKGLTIVPIEIYTSHGLLKARIAIVRGKGKADRREDLKKRDAMREAGREVSNRFKN